MPYVVSSNFVTEAPSEVPGVMVLRHGVLVCARTAALLGEHVVSR
jgi:hypothetical protein